MKLRFARATTLLLLTTAATGAQNAPVTVRAGYFVTLFAKGEVDAAWASEPWASLLIHEGGGRLFFDERNLWPNRQFVADTMNQGFRVRSTGQPNMGMQWTFEHQL